MQSPLKRGKGQATAARRNVDAPRDRVEPEPGRTARAAAERVLAEIEARRAAGYVPATSPATAADALGDSERALDLLEQGYRERDVRMSFLLLDGPQLRG